MIKWLGRGILLIVAAYLLLAASVTAAMLQPPARFGQIMRYVPAPMVWGLLPGPRIWLWARQRHAGRRSAGTGLHIADLRSQR